jgi:citrate lyase subunit beta / citryl-CoA lyase
VSIERSYLFVPGDRPERFAKAFASSADRVILDLEDAVQPSAKHTARETVERWLRDVGHSDRLRAVVRINGADTTWYAEDVAALGALPATVDVMLPKSESEDVIAAVHAATRASLVLLVETVAGLLNVRRMAACGGVARIAFGSVDFCSDAGIEGEHEELDFVRSQLVLESRFAALPAPIDGVTVALDDDERIRRDVARSRRFGFGAKLCIHPKQVPAVNVGFEPTTAEREWAQRVLSACERAGGQGAIFGRWEAR